MPENHARMAERASKDITDFLARLAILSPDTDSLEKVKAQLREELAKNPELPQHHIQFIVSAIAVVDGEKCFAEQIEFSNYTQVHNNAPKNVWSLPDEIG